MRQSEVAPANDRGLLLLGQFVRIVVPKQFAAIFFKPHRQSLPLLRGQLKNRAFELFQAHNEQV